MIYNANRWSALAPWLAGVRNGGLNLDQRTAIVVDIDKTALGAKGRNDHVIDRARLEGIFRTMTAVLGVEGFNKPLFVEHYTELNRARYHFLTADNQDYLTYICLVLNTGLVSFDELMGEIENSSLDNFDQFIRWVDSRMMINDAGSETFREVHEAVLSSVRAGDPTPFKRFRRQEFVCTVEHMGFMADDASAAEMLAGEITLTRGSMGGGGVAESTRLLPSLPERQAGRGIRSEQGLHGGLPAHTPGLDPPCRRQLERGAC